MQMRTGGVAGAPDAGDLLAARHLFALRDQVPRVVRVDRHQIPVVGEQDQLSITPSLAGEEHHPVVGGADGRPFGTRQIDAFVVIAVALPEPGDEHARRRPGQGLPPRGGIEGTPTGARDRRGRVAPGRAHPRGAASRLRGRHRQLPLGTRDPQLRPRGDLGGVLERVLAQQHLQRHRVRAADAPEGLSGAHVMDGPALPPQLFLGPRRPLRARVEGEKERQSRTSPGSSQRFSSSTSSCAVRSRCNGVTEMSRRSNTASQSLPGTCSCACSSPPIQ